MPPVASTPVWVIIDAQRGFIDPAGSLARTCGIEELQPGLAALGRIREGFTTGKLDGSLLWVRSEYLPGQFTGGDLTHGLADICVPGKNVDCEWAAGLNPAAGDIVTKHQADAWQSETFRRRIEQFIQSGVQQIYVIGFQYTTCVEASAVSLASAVRERGVRVTVIEAMTGSRLSSAAPGESGISRIEMTRRRLKTAGVEVS